jgi:hypothetical protein
MSTLTNLINDSSVVNAITNDITNIMKNQLIDVDLGDVVCYPIVITDSNGNQSVTNNTVNIENLNQYIAETVVANVLSSNQQLVTAVTTLDNQIQQTAQATSLGLFDGIKTALSSPDMWMALVAIAAVMAIGGGLKKKTNDDLKKSGADPNDSNSWANMFASMKFNENSIMGALTKKGGKYFWIVVAVLVLLVGIFVMIGVILIMSPTIKSSGSVAVNACFAFMIIFFAMFIICLFIAVFFSKIVNKEKTLLVCLVLSFILGITMFALTMQQCAKVIAAANEKLKSMQS